MCGGGVWWGGVCGLCWGVWVGVHAISARSRRDLGAISVHLDVLEVLLGDLELLRLVLAHL